MLKNYPIYFSEVGAETETQILFPLKWDEDSEIIENENESEAGTDLVSVVRYDKLTVSASFKCSSGWVKTFKNFAKMPYIRVRSYDIIDEAYKTRNMRLRDFSNKLIKYSERINATFPSGVVNGLWEVSFKLEEI